MADCCILFTTTLQKQNAAPRFPLVSFCRCCFLPAVFFRFRSKNRACFIQASKRIPLQSLSVSNRPYICTHPPYRRNSYVFCQAEKRNFLVFLCLTAPAPVNPCLHPCLIPLVRRGQAALYIPLLYSSL